MWLWVFSVDILHSYRVLSDKARRHPIIAGWFIVLMVGSVWFLLRLINMMQNMELPLSLSASRLLFLIFLFFLTKSAVDERKNTVQNRSLLHIMMQPIDLREIMLAKFMRMIWYNLGLLALALGVFVCVLLLTPFSSPLNAVHTSTIIVLTLIASVLGLPLAIFGSLSGKKRVLGLWVSSLPVSAVLIILERGSIFLAPVFLLITFSFALVIAIAPKSAFMEAWNTQSTAKASAHPPAAISFFGLKDVRLRSLAGREWLLRLREKDVLGSLLTVVFLFCAQIFIYRELGPIAGFHGPYAKYVYPSAVASLIYLAFTLECVIPGMSMIGKEQHTLWILRILPISGAEIAASKIIAQLALVPIFLAFVALPLPLFLHFPILLIFFCLFGALAMAFLFAAVGLWAGVRFPNFDPTVRGAPEVMSMYAIMMLCLILAAVVLGVPALVYLSDRFLGLLAIILCADICAFVLWYVVHKMGKVLEKMEM